jgi:hypothetical protein
MSVRRPPRQPLPTANPKHLPNLGVDLVELRKHHLHFGQSCRIVGFDILRVGQERSNLNSPLHQVSESCLRFW